MLQPSVVSVVPTQDYNLVLNFEDGEKNCLMSLHISVVIGLGS